MDLKEIRYFAQVARAGSFNRAADELRVAQPALSRKIRKLEQELGVDLLVRHGRGVRLTTAGSKFLKSAESIAHLVRQSGEDLRTKAPDMIGHVSLGVPPVAGLLLVPPLLAAFRKQAPLVSVHIREGISTSLQEWLLDRRIDIAVLHNPPPLQTLDIEPVLTERMVVFGPKARIKSGKRRSERLRVADLADLPLIMPSMPHNNRRLLEQVAVQHGIRLNIVLEVDSVALTKALAKRGLGYSLITFAAVQEEARRGTLAIYPIERPPLTSTVAIATPNDVQVPPYTRDLTALLRTIIRKLVRDGDWAGATVLQG